MREWIWERVWLGGNLFSIVEDMVDACKEIIRTTKEKLQRNGDPRRTKTNEMIIDCLY